MNFLICGAGHAGKALHGTALKTLNQKIIGFVDPFKENGEDAASIFQTKYFSSINEACESERIDVVTICSSTSSHLTLAEEALKNGIKSIIIEKPIVENIQDLNKLNALRNKYNANVCSVHNHRFYESYETARSKLKELGEIVSIRRVMAFNYSSIRMMEPNHWSHKIPGGRLFEANPHNIYTIYSLIGEFEIESASVISNTSRDYSQIESFSCLGKAADDVLINIEMSMSFENSSHKELSRTEIYGKKKCMLITNSSLYIGETLQGFKKQNLIKPFYYSINPFKRKKFNVKPAGSGHLQFYSKFISEKNEIIPFQETLFTQNMNELMAKLCLKKL